MLSSKDIIKAHKVLNGVVVNTPLDYDHYLSEKYGAKIYLKKAKQILLLGKVVQEKQYSSNHS